MKLFKLSGFIFIFIVVYALATHFHALAQSQSIINVDFPGAVSAPQSIQEYISQIYKFALGIAGFLAVAMIVAGSVVYSTSAGRPDRQNEAKDMIVSALWGIALILGSYLILNSINPVLITQFNSEELPSINSAGGLINCSDTKKYPVSPGFTYIYDPVSAPNYSSTTVGSTYPCRKVRVAQECPKTVLTACPGKIVLKSVIPKGTNMFGGIRAIPFGASASTPIQTYKVLATVTTDFAPHGYFYDDNADDDMLAETILWTYPYYIPDDSWDSNGIPSQYVGANKAQCLIFAYGVCGDAGCTMPNVKTTKPKLQDYLKHC